MAKQHNLQTRIAALTFVIFVMLGCEVFAQPANDAPCSATALTVGAAGSCSYTTGTTVAATASLVLPSPDCGNFQAVAGHDVWYSVSVPASGNIEVVMDTGTQVSGGLALYQTGAGCFPVIWSPGIMECDTGDGVNGMPYIIASGLTPSSTVYLRVWEPNNDAKGTFKICVTDPVNPSGNPCGGVPDSCSIACDLGTLLPPAYCDGTAGQGSADTATLTLTNVGATASSPYVFMGGCQGGANMGSPAADVWYTFKATGPILYVEITGNLSIPNVALWDGACGSLLGKGCATDSSGTLAVSFDGLTAMETYFLQISGGDTNDTGTFTLKLNNSANCTDCLQDISLTADPPPSGGVYAPATSVTFTVTVNKWNRVQQNDLHGVEVDHAVGWDTSTITTTPPSACDGAGNWAWYNSCTGAKSGQTFGTGFYYDSNTGGSVNGDPGDNYGDLCPGGGLTFKWTVTTDTFNCVGPNDLLITVNTTGDGESGNWDTLACASDQEITFNAAVSCLLPIDLVYIDADKAENGNRVHWATATELTNDYYRIERSIDGYNFVEAGIVDGGGSTQKRNDYEFIDEYMHPGTVWYRVQQIDMNGNGNFTETVSVEPSGAEVYINRIHPNPVKNDLNIDLVVQENGNFLIETLDLTGRVLTNERFDLDRGVFALAHDVSDLAAGQYIVRLRDLSSGSTIVQKFVK